MYSDSHKTQTQGLARFGYVKDPNFFQRLDPVKAVRACMSVYVSRTRNLSFSVLIGFYAGSINAKEEAQVTNYA